MRKPESVSVIDEKIANNTADISDIVLAWQYTANALEDQGYKIDLNRGFEELSEMFPSLGRYAIVLEKYEATLPDLTKPQNKAARAAALRAQLEQLRANDPHVTIEPTVSSTTTRRPIVLNGQGLVLTPAEAALRHSN